MGKVPALRHGDTVITEAAAICTYLADEFPAAKLNVPIGTPRRGVYLKWLFFGPSCIEPAVIDRAAPRKEEARRGMLGYGDFDTTMNTVAAAVAKGPWLMGEQFTAADVVIGANIRWGMMFKMIPERPEFTAYAARHRRAPGRAARRGEGQGARGEVRRRLKPVARRRGPANRAGFRQNHPFGRCSCAALSVWLCRVRSHEDCRDRDHAWPMSLRLSSGARPVLRSIFPVQRRLRHSRVTCAETASQRPPRFAQTSV